MGGMIFNSQGITARRIDSKEFFDTVSYFLPILEKIFKKSDYIKSYLTKDSHGDIDFLISEPLDTYTDWRKQIVENDAIQKRITNIVYNNDEVSILNNGAQLDFRIIKPKYWESSVYFCNYDPSSNALGRIARWMGSRFGYKGLVYPVYTENGENRLDDIILSDSPQKIEEFFGLKPKDNFNNKEKIFEYITSNKYYGIDCFKEENWDNATRTRNRKRKLFCELVEYLCINHNYNKIEYLSRERKSEYINLYNESFPEVNLKERVFTARKEYRVNKELTNKFNGSTVIALTDLRGAKLGKVLGEYKNSKDNFMEFLKNNSQEQIKQDFLNYHNAK